MLIGMNPPFVGSAKSLSGSRSRRALMTVFTVALLGSGVLAVMAQSTAKPGSEVWTAPPRAARKENPLPSEAKSIAQGKELFEGACLPCHGTFGKGDGPAAAALEREGKPIRPGDLSNPKLRDQTDGALFWKVSEGKTPMPAFQEAFTEEQRWQVINYVRTLAIQPSTPNQPVKSEAKP